MANKCGRKPGKAQLTKAVLASEISDLLQLPRGHNGSCPKGRQIVDAILKTMKKALWEGDEVSVRYWGTLKVEMVTPLKFPRTIERKFNGKRAYIELPPRKKVRFYQDPTITPEVT